MKTRDIIPLAGMAACALVAATPAVAIDTVRVSAEQWDAATERDGTGLYFDILRAVYEPEGIAVEHRSVPYARSIREVMVTDKGDLWVASYMDEVEGALFPKWHFDADVVQAAYDADEIGEVTGEQSLAGRDVAWMRGYAYDDYLSVDVSATRVDDRNAALEMVARGRVDFFIDAAIELDIALEETGYGETLADAAVLDLPLYMGFANTDRGRRLRTIWDRRMPELLADGTIAALYQQYEWGKWPFDDKYR